MPVPAPTPSDALSDAAVPPPALPRGERLARRAALLVVVLYPIAAALLLLWPAGWLINRTNLYVWMLVVRPLGLADELDPERFSDLLNVFLFIPFFAAVALLVPRWSWILLGAALSGAVETYQYVIGTRVASLVDVVMNTLGAALGVALGILAARLLSGARTPTGALAEPASDPVADPTMSGPTGR